MFNFVASGRWYKARQRTSMWNVLRHNSYSGAMCVVKSRIRYLGLFGCDLNITSNGCQNHRKTFLFFSSSSPGKHKELTETNLDVQDQPIPNVMEIDHIKSKLNYTNADEDVEKPGRWSSQLTWLNNILDSALKLYKGSFPEGNGEKGSGPANTRSLVDIAINLHRSTPLGMQEWSLGDLTFGLYLLSLRHASERAVDSIKGKQILSDYLVDELIYHVELAKGAYMKDAAGLARVSMLRESNIVRFMNKASVMRPAYYIGIDTRWRLVILGIRGTQSVHDLITDLISHSQDEIMYDGGSVHYGTAEAANWFMKHELETIRDCLRKRPGFELRLVGHSLGGATASLLAMFLRKMRKEDLGFCPSIVSAVGIATPPCVSRNLALTSTNFVRTLVLQDDLIPRMSATSMFRLRNEILTTDWTTLLKGEEYKSFLELIASTVQALSSLQDVARRYAAYAKISNSPHVHDNKHGVPKSVSSEESSMINHINQGPLEEKESAGTALNKTSRQAEELLLPGVPYHICMQSSDKDDEQKVTEERKGCILLKGDPGQFFRRIILSGSMLSDHKCDSYYQGLRDVLKGLPHQWPSNLGLQ